MLSIIKEQLNSLQMKAVNVYDLSGQNPFYDYLLIATATSPQVSAFLHRLKKELGLSIDTTEGLNSPWVLIKTDNILIHLFNQEARDEYKLDLMFKPFLQVF